MKKKLLVLVMLLILLSSWTILAMSSSKDMDKTLVEGYQTLIGQIYEEGTATMSFLIFRSQNGYDYLISGKLKNKLRSLKGVTLMLTGKVSDLNLEGKLTQAKFDVILYDLEYNLESEEVSVLGKLVEEKESLVLITKKQEIFNLDPNTYHSLQKHLGEEVVINGSLEMIDQYHGKIKLKSYQIIE
ncbi:hypothetical protein [Orenia marismortui]|uniref:Uncharacterized protein n=1 Tax=Orenia marismortui TaxID=46469 RepID=A0A4R8H0W1_9FIRM|nr:hypothetical protein [Orenia marismortui]TDX52954.1 hypothetical protein C7959_10480 [Orenia marismortui]